MKAQDVADELAQDLLDWMERTTTDCAAALLDSPLAPQVAAPTQAESLAYWHSQLFLPDGSPNPQGRDALIGPPPYYPGAAQYETIAKALVAAHEGPLPGPAQQKPLYPVLPGRLPPVARDLGNQLEAGPMDLGQ